MTKGNWLISLLFLLGAALCVNYFGLFERLGEWSRPSPNAARQISEVSLVFDQTTLQFTRSADHWVGTKEGVVLQNTGAKFDSLLQVLADLENSVFKTDKTALFEQFGVDEKSALQVKYVAAGKSTQIFVGTFDSIKVATYFRYGGSEVIFMKNGNLRALISDQLSDYRFNVLPEVNADQLTDIQYYWNDKLVFGYNSSAERWCSQLNSFEVNGYDFEDYLYRINDLRSTVEDRQTIDQRAAINSGSIVFNYRAMKQSSAINFVESIGKNKIYYLFDPLQKNNYLKLDSATFFEKIWVNPSTFIKNN